MPAGLRYRALPVAGNGGEAPVGREGPRSRRMLRGALVLAALVTLVAWRAATESIPRIVLSPTLAAYVRLGAGRPTLAWPREGQATVEVEGADAPLASAGRQAPAPIASLAKVMTAFLTLREHPIAPGAEGFRMTITAQEAAEEHERLALDQSVLPVRAGERISEREALEALMVPSANNIAALLAANEGGVGAFVATMNATARSLGMSQTTYTDPSGFTATTVSTAVDQLKLAAAAMAMPAFAALVDERTAVLPLAGVMRNLNALVGEDGYVGVKTGSDSAAGGCLIFAKRALVAGRRLIVLGVVLGQRSGAYVEVALASAQRLGDSAAAAVRVRTALPAGTRALSARGADGGRTSAVTAGALSALGWSGAPLLVHLHVQAAPSTLRGGERLGSVTLGGATNAASALVAARALGGPSLGWRLGHLL